MIDLHQLWLVLFFTEGVSLGLWESGGLFQREVALYRALRPHIGGITFVTYGDGRDLDFSNRLEGIQIICNRWKLGPQWYRRTLPLLLHPRRKGPVIFKTNQVRGGEIPLYLSKRFGKPCIARCGYLVSDYLQWQDGEHAPATQRAMMVEKNLFSQADRCVVTTLRMKNLLMTNYKITDEKISIIPNYVDTELFAPDTVIPRNKRRIIFIGRLDRVKNLFALVEALRELDVELWIVGEGSERQNLETSARHQGVSVRFLGIRPHHELPRLINSATAFILPSFSEGHPKTLLEALSCGVPCIGSSIPSIRGVIQHGENGMLCGLDPQSIRQTIIEVLEQPAMQKTLGDNARAYALRHLNLDRVVEMELEVYRQLMPLS